MRWHNFSNVFNVSRITQHARFHLVFWFELDFWELGINYQNNKLKRQLFRRGIPICIDRLYRVFFSEILFVYQSEKRKSFDILEKGLWGPTAASLDKISLARSLLRWNWQLWTINIRLTMGDVVFSSGGFTYLDVDLGRNAIFFFLNWQSKKQVTNVFFRYFIIQIFRPIKCLAMILINIKKNTSYNFSYFQMFQKLTSE